MTSRASNSTQPILLMDGECLLCHGLARFVFKREAKRRFRFAALRSEAGRYALERAGWCGRWIETAEEAARDANAKEADLREA
ncbi:MAG: DCC1-like thiol-disulfide oxidoreductase family protein [Paenibacillus dendritiformis]|uniref:DCC1-like thiol-disulfide oxidoreductase family protein n=1 Tax=Paenibacillus dendritiformis TaxID=130049 RepID=UPI00143DC893|nr:DCC1-like thiol-disulfide oxidoreductase family protein [Paenibacillus dendritiformis]MDU5140778.1 DCC1-like thiol-disulfide oxidoreductase family protein [Paenibacillus dendritiformis]NKI22519.1 DUF393 domain-containing protein [Paenibacillus dendritiformis]NRF97652.1 DUF393 domain-containing protein [Paenibacillus dendritiformis]GIO71091.1 hypothetical protein J27TS7_06050 [Paenibacillus dendritiformis]